jgi:hypothetical protein
VGALVPLLFLEDQLTQSTILLAFAVAALLAYAGRTEGREQRMARGLPRAVRWITLSVYALAAVHKLNRDFFDPAVSCANGGLRLLAGDAAPLLGWSGVPVAYVAIELGLALVLLWRPAIGVAFAAWMHLPLTIIFAPSFAFTMMSGWLSFLREDELRALWVTLRRRWWVVLIGGGVPAALSRAAFFPGRWQTDPDWCIKEVLLWLVAAWLLEAVTSRWRGGLFRGRGPWNEAAPASLRVALLACAFVLHGLTPYLGVQFHHTGAMLSNLRIDRGCHNSLLFPEALRASDPYVRIDEVAFAPHRAGPAIRAAALARLWSLDALWRERARWCAVHREPLPLAGSYRGEPFEAADFCADDGWSLPRPWLTGMRRFQVNLSRDCPQACVH